MLYEVIPIKIFRQQATTLTYHSDSKLAIGQIVLVPLGKTTTPAIVAKTVKSVDFPTKPILQVLYSTPLPSHIIPSIFWLSEFYANPLQSSAKLFLPQGITKNRRAKLPAPSSFTNSNTPPNIPLNSAQQTALQTINKNPSPTRMLHGITGSGKTNIYLALAQQTLQNHQSVILLVPEISLTSQLVQIFQNTFKTNITLMHSKQTESIRHQMWENILNSTTPQIIIGARSALTLPIQNLGLIIIDEAHEPAYFQENPPKYSALRLASFITNYLHFHSKTTSNPPFCLLGTATPLIQDFYLANQRNSIITLNQKAKSSAIRPEIHLIDLKNRQNFTKNRYFSNQLLTAIRKNLENHHQTLIFHNRRGSAPLTICENCGWQALCPHCFLPLTLHNDQYQLLCHTCGYHTKVSTTCPSCGHPDIIHKGVGTKLLENQLQTLFPNAKIARFDADNTKSESLANRYQELKLGEIDILIGTQTVAKGLDLPYLATVGIIQADTGLSLPDFSTPERTFHLLTQVIGRVGRGHLNHASVFIQTYQPEHPVIQSAIAQDYQFFYNHLLSERQKAFLPPFSHLAKLSLTYKTEATTLKNIQKLHQELTKILQKLPKNSPKTTITPPLPAFHERSNQGFTWEIILKSTSHAQIIKIITQLPPSSTTKLSLSVAPPSLL